MNEGETIREQYVVRLKTEHAEVAIDLAVFLPAKKTNVGGFLGLNFQGNHAVDPDPALRIPSSWMRDNPKRELSITRPTKRGEESSEIDGPFVKSISEDFLLRRFTMETLTQISMMNFTTGCMLFSQIIVQVKTTKIDGDLSGLGHGDCLAS